MRVSPFTCDAMVFFSRPTTPATPSVAGDHSAQSKCFQTRFSGHRPAPSDGVLNPKKNQSEKKFYLAYWPIKADDAQISTAMRVLAEIIASDVSLLVTFNHAIDGVIQNNPKARANPKALAQLDGYKRPLVSSLSGNLQRFGMERVGKVESLQEIIAKMTEPTGTTGEALFVHRHHPWRDQTCNELRTSDPLIKSLSQRGPERNINKKPNYCNAHPVGVTQWELFVLPRFRHRISTQSIGHVAGRICR